MPLPQLKVLRETYCSQQVADDAIAWVEAHRPELIENLMLYEHWRQQDYREAAWDILEYLTEEKVEIPTSLIGRMDLINEFTRRGRSAHGKPEIPPKGRPLASGPDQPLPPLIKLPTDEGTKRARNELWNQWSKLADQTSWTRNASRRMGDLASDEGRTPPKISSRPLELWRCVSLALQSASGLQVRLGRLKVE